MGKPNPESMSKAELERVLTDRQKRFVLEYMRNGFNGTEAAIAAGYAERSAHVQASRMLNNATIAAYRRACAQELYKAAGISPAQIGLNILSVFNRCMAAEPHLSWDSDTRSYVPDGTFVFDSRGALKALELLGKMEGAFSERVEISGNVEDYIRKLEEAGSGQTF